MPVTSKIFQKIISKQMSNHFQAIWKSQHRHLATASLFSLSDFFFEKIVSYGHQYHFATNTISLRFPFHLSRGVHRGSRKMLFELSEAFVYWCFEEITAPKFLHTSLKNIQVGILFKYPCRSSWDFSEKLFRAAILYRTCLCKKELHSTRYLRTFPEF